MEKRKDETKHNVIFINPALTEMDRYMLRYKLWRSVFQRLRGVTRTLHVAITYKTKLQVITDITEISLIFIGSTLLSVMKPKWTVQHIWTCQDCYSDWSCVYECETRSWMSPEVIFINSILKTLREKMSPSPTWGGPEAQVFLIMSGISTSTNLNPAEHLCCVC